jgi:hypothetical protein
MDNNFSVDELVAEASAVGWFDGVAAAVWVAVHEVRMQDTHVRRVHLRHQAMRLEPDFGVNPMRASRMKDPSEERGWRLRRAHCC